MGTTPNVGLMAQKAEEYGSHDKTFEIASAGHGARGRQGRQRAPGARRRGRRHLARVPDQGRADPGLDPARGRPRPRDRRARRLLARRDPRARRASCSRRSGPALDAADTDGLQIEILPVAEAARFTLERARRGEDTISVTGNVLRDYLTDLFPILELGTSAKMLSIVPLMNGGGLFETGAGGTRAQARPAVPEGEPPALGLARRVPGAGGLVRDARREDRQRARPAPRRHAGPGDRPRAGGGPLAVAQGRRARQPRQPLLPRALLGAGAGGADRRRRAGRRSFGRWPSALRRRRVADRRRARRRPGRARSTSAATSTPTPRAPPRRCGRARPSTRP